ncbi:hypothetical protein MCEGE10_02706 [Flavobacteriaceae bacterium]
MKKIFTLLALIVTLTIFAQAPQGFNYQATVRNATGTLITNQNVYFKFNIMLNSQTSVPIYTETHYVPTDDLGQVNLVIGTGTASVGTFATISWSTGSYFLGIELKVSPSTTYVPMGTTQLLSVPYAMYANSAGSTTAVSGFSHYVGELYGGGIVVSIWKTNGIEHGLIASLTDIGSSIWSNITTDIGITAQSSNNGQANTNAIIAQAGHITSAAKLCNDYTSGGYSDWYLPAHWELNQCYYAAYILNETLGNTNGFKFDEYACSTEYSGGSFLGENFSRSALGYPSKSGISIVRAVRKF